jgi:hypothetical protein
MFGLDRFRDDTRGQIGGGRLDLLAIMITVIAAAVTGYVGLNVMTTTRSQAGLTNTSDFYGAQTNLTAGVESFFSGLGTVFTVIVLVVILSYLMLLRGR